MNHRLGGTAGLPSSVSSRAVDQPGTAGRASSGTRRPAPISFAPRSVMNCLDLAVMYIGRQLPMMLVLWLCAAVPSCAVVYVLSYYHGFDLRMTLAVIYVATAVLGGWLIAAMTPGVFGHMVGESHTTGDEGRSRSVFSAATLNLAAVVLSGVLLALILAPESALATVGDAIRLLVVILLGLVLFARAAGFLREQSDRRIGVSRPLLAVFPLRALMSIGPALCLFSGNWWLIVLGVILTVFLGIPLAIRFGFLTERACLQQLHRRLHHRGTDDLLKAGLGDLLVRGCGIVIFSGMLWFVLFLTVDIMSSLLFQVPILIGRLAEMDIDSERFWVFLATDPLVMTVLTVTALAVYTIGRLAWFLCYIDVRVRQDCWDLELSIMREAVRLRESM